VQSSLRGNPCGIEDRLVVLTEQQRSLRARIGGFARAARYDGRDVTEAARSAFLDRFRAEVDPDGVLPEEERERRAQAARRAYFARLAFESSKARATRTARAEQPRGS
jgi:hypothetical protein